MSDQENRNDIEGAPAEATDGQPEAPAAPEPGTVPEAPDAAAPDGPQDAGPRGKGRLRRVLVPLLAAALVLGAACGGLAYTKATVNGADVSAPTKVWKKPARTPSEDDPVPDLREGRTDGELRRKLLPVPEDFRLGPDVSEFGNDTELSGRQAQALLREGGKGLPGKERRRHREYVEKLRVQGIAMRTYTPYDNRFTAEIQLARMKNEKGVKDLSGFQSGLADALSVFRDGPKIKGHDNARCFLPPEDGDSELDAMFCTAYQDEYLISFRVDGVKPFERKDAAELLKDQLDHLASPGEYV
ncbi:hypothetical protein IQ279_03190 [Streptomyces verrucosisporus]|uniref:hypothetical protein n=1 Tax=Streptomyces verrucosisporus TaxID=1695161 RepID=UPI0019D05029|nr:hypothetical protein [Streptomyces verrucosisporus]MBN3928660.1 hypothetical protein [Streptomyces verrucosisporus]